MFQQSIRWPAGLLCLSIVLFGSTAACEEASSQPISSAEQEAGPQGEQTTKPATTQGQPLRLNFKDTSLQAILEYLSEAAGLVIVGEAPVDGGVTVMSRRPMSTEEAISLLDTLLRL